MRIDMRSLLWFYSRKWEIHVNKRIYLIRIAKAGRRGGHVVLHEISAGTRGAGRCRGVARVPLNVTSARGGTNTATASRSLSLQKPISNTKTFDLVTNQQHNQSYFNAKLILPLHFTGPRTFFVQKIMCFNFQLKLLLCSRFWLRCVFLEVFCM